MPRPAALALFFLAIVGSRPAAAQSGCHLNEPLAFACFDPSAAAQAWLVNGHDQRALEHETTVAALREAGCGTFTSLAAPGAAIQVKAAADAATERGSVRVLYLRVITRNDRPAAIWLAAAYITGACAKAE